MADEVTTIPVAESAVPAAVPADAAAPVLPAAAASSTVVEAPKEAAPAEATPVSQPSLLETAAGKPKEAKAKADAKASPETPAPAEAKPEATEAKPEEKKPEVKAEDAKKDEAKPDPAKEATVQPEPPAPVKYEAFKVPDGIKLDDKELSKFTDVVGAAQVKQEDAQKLVDLYVAERQRDVDLMRQEQRRVWDTLNDTWKSDLRKDPVLGGNRLETNLSIAKAVVEEYGGSPEQVRDLLAHTTNNGMGNYPGFVRLLHNIGLALNVFEDNIVGANPTAPKQQKGPGNRGWYSGMNGA